MAKGVIVTKSGGTTVQAKQASLDVARRAIERGASLRLSLLEARVAVLQDMLERYLADPSKGADLLKEIRSLSKTLEADGGGGGDAPKRPTPATPKRPGKKPVG
jgi:hypothetical protein